MTPSTVTPVAPVVVTVTVFVLSLAQLETALLITGLASAVTEICGVVVVLQVSDTPVILIIPLVEFGI